VDLWEAAGSRFEVVLASDVERDGMALELTRLDESGSGPALEAFYSDADGSMTFLAHRPTEVPLEVVERFIQRARAVLPPQLIECPVCGSRELTSPPYETWPPPAGAVLSPPYAKQLGAPSYEVCPNCGFEFGNDDDPGTAPARTFEDYRVEWIAEGRRRFDAG
jgi:RNA polymerase subunit RPABC4/transcription elongation factor Spt4